MRKLIITESEKRKILNMHGFKKMLSEATLVDVQNLLNTKFSSGLTPDGKYGPKTAAAIEKALSGGSATKAGTTPTGGGAGTTPVGATPLSSNKTPPGSVAGTPNVGDIAGGDKGESSMAGV
jgi:hypothetical protein